MSHADFAHLHLRTGCSLLDGTCQLGWLADQAHELTSAQIRRVAEVVRNFSKS